VTTADLASTGPSIFLVELLVDRGGALGRLVAQTYLFQDRKVVTYLFWKGDGVIIIYQLRPALKGSAGSEPKIRTAVYKWMLQYYIVIVIV
jgi:hypothetical protein